MKKYVSFIGSLLFDQFFPDPTDTQKKTIFELTEKYCTVAFEFGRHLTKGGHSVKAGSFSELDSAFVRGAIQGAKSIGENPQERVVQILGGFTVDGFLNSEAAQVQLPMEDDFLSGRSSFIAHAKAIVLLGGHYYAKMLTSWAYNLGIPVFALPQGQLAGAEIWKHLVSSGHRNDSSSEIFPGITREDYEEIGIMNSDASWLAAKLYELIEKSSKCWVKPSVLPDDMRYKPHTRQVAANSAFVAMSFSHDKNAVFHAIREACDASGFSCLRGDNDAFYQQDLNIMTNVMEYIVRSHVIIVDLSDRNPNVFYEMGVADTLGKPMILLFDGNGSVPFDVASLRHLRYSPESLDELVTPLSGILSGFRLSS